MGIIKRAIKVIHYADDMSNKSNWLNNLHPLSKLVITLWYLILVVSVSKYGLGVLLAMSVFPIMTMIFADIPIGKTLKNLWPVLLILSLPGIANLIIDQSNHGQISGIIITGGMISMLTLFVKGILGVFASFILMISTSIEDICYALQSVRVPKKITVLIMLIYRYLILLLKEAERIMLAYEVRSIGQTAVKYKVWGTLAGMLFLRSSDRAQLVYESMSLRGFNGTFHHKKISFRLMDLVTILLGMATISFLRIINWGNLFTY